MRVLAQPAFVLHARPWRETSLLVEVLTRDHGRVGLVARGLGGAKKHALRAALQPLQSLRIDFLPRGELARLLQAEAQDAAPLLAGDRLMAAFYINELLLRLLPRGDVSPELYELYARVRHELTDARALAWNLRRFERDLLDLLGYGLPWDAVADDQPVHAATRYRLDPERGPVPDPRRADGSVSGAALLALAADREPEPLLLAELRLGLRDVLAAHLGASGLRSWGLMGELARVRTRSQD
ncbi:DNA repair protein RecO [Arenimonas sp.]|uniref:DNA repair protein RecO n=1 Tax=Arenimonas sp. TaxID=1872635 RepID=UPI0039E65A5E